MADDFDFDDEGALPRKRDNLFLWTVFILLLIGLAFACWLGSFYIFGHPEQPRAYEILKRLKKIEAPKRFEEIAAPPGEFLSAQKLFERYSPATRLELERENSLLLRNFLNNYRETKKLVPYVRGNFTITAAAELTPRDFFSTGMVALGVSNDFPQVLIEHLYPMSPENLEASRRLLVAGNPIKLERTYDLGAVIHVEKIPDGRVQLTVVPLLYGRYALNGGVGTFSTEPPATLNVAQGLPVLRTAQVETALKTYADARRGQMPAEMPEPGETPEAPKGPEIVRLAALPEGAKVPETGALPEMPVATPIPVASANPAGRKPPTQIAMLARPTPLPVPIAVATPLAVNPRPPASAPSATPAPNIPPGVIKPFIAANPQPGLPSAQGNLWRTYKPGGAPPGRPLTTSDAGTLVDRGAVSERNYLQGNFVVTASGENRAVLRPRAGADATNPTPIRVIVEYPNGAVPPAEGSALDRDELRPYEIREVRRGATGEVNIWVREIMQP